MSKTKATVKVRVEGMTRDAAIQAAGEMGVHIKYNKEGRPRVYEKRNEPGFFVYGTKAIEIDSGDNADHR